MIECFHREREDGYCWRCEEEKQKARIQELSESVPSPRTIEKIGEEFGEQELDGESDH